MVGALAALVLAGLCLDVGASQPADHEDDFYRGAALESEGHYAEAVEVFNALVAAAPHDRFADDSLAELGRLYEEKLADPVRALAVWERLAHDYPDSRLALRAEKRAEALRQALGPDPGGADALAALDRLIYGTDHPPRAQTIDALTRLIGQYPDAPSTAHATLWLGTLLLEDGQFQAGLARLHEVETRWPKSEWATRAFIAEGDALVDDGDLDAAERAFANLTGDSRADAMVRVGRARRARHTEWAAWGVLALGAGLALVVGRGRLRPPIEVWYLLPIAILLSAAALASQDAPIGRAVAIVAGGGLGVAWLSGAALDAARLRGRVTLALALVHAALAAAAVAAVCYIAVNREHLVDTVVETLRFGAE